jgi:hypothetical protein
MLRVAFFFLMTCLLSAQEGLRYRMQLWPRTSPGAIESPLELRFTLRSASAIRTTNRVQKLRMGGWMLEADRSEGTPYQQAMLMARARRLLYLSGPAQQTKAEAFSIRFRNRSCPVWRLEIPKGLSGSVVLIDIASKLLAVCDLNVSFPKGDIARIEMHLESIGEGLLFPSEEGTILLSTLEAWAKQGPSENSDEQLR